MFLTLDNWFSEEPTALVQVDASQIDVSEFKDEQDQSFLITHGHELMRIDAKAEQAKEQICKAIDAKANDAKGKLIYEIQERFKNTPELKGGLMRYFHSLGYWESSTMSRMGLEKPGDCQSLQSAFLNANAYRAALEMERKLVNQLPADQIQDRARSLPASVLGRIYTSFSEKDRESYYERIAKGEGFTVSEVAADSREPEAKLSKAEELLARARIRKQEAEARWEEVKANPEVSPQDREYKTASKMENSAGHAVTDWEAKVADLQAQVEAKEAELNKFKFDEDLKRQERIKALTSALTVGVPQATADLNKYIKDAEYYPSEVRRHFDDQIKVLADMCGDYLSRI